MSMTEIIGILALAGVALMTIAALIVEDGRLALRWAMVGLLALFVAVFFTIQT